MKITNAKTQIVRIPLRKPIPSAWLTISHVSCVLLTLETDAGPSGEAMIFTLNDRKIAVIDEIVRSLTPLVVGTLAGDSGATVQAIRRELTFFGQQGVTLFGLAAIDGALWDLRAKGAGVNVAELIGAYRRAMPIYVSGSLRLSASIDELQREAEGILKKGFRGMKMSLGKPDPNDDVARVRAVREAVGPKVRLMSDVNQQLTVPQAIRLGRRLEEFLLEWIEEPVAAANHAGEAQVAAALDTPVASGESVFGRAGFEEMLRLRSADILMPDLERIGGPTEFFKIAHLADAYNVPISSHLFTHMSLALMAAIPNGLYLEYMPWFDELYDHELTLDDDGCAVLPQRPGWGFSFAPAAVARFSV